MKDKTEELLVEQIERLERKVAAFEEDAEGRRGIFSEGVTARMDTTTVPDPEAQARFDGKHFMRTRLPGCVTAYLLHNFNVYELTLLPDGELPPPAEGVRLALFIVEPKDDMGLAWQAPMSIAPLWGYPHLNTDEPIEIIIDKALYTITMLEPIDVQKVEESWGETVAGRARTDVPCVCFRMDLKDVSKDYSQEIAAAKAKIEAFWNRIRG